MRTKFALNITPSTTWKAKQYATAIVEGDADRQYSLLRRYAEELRSKCKHNTVKIGVERPIPSDLHPRFGNFYFCFDGCGHNASSCKSTVQDPNGLKRKRKPPKGKVHAEAKPGADPKSDANPSKEPIPEANPSQAQKPAPVEADQNPISATVEVSQVENPTQNSATVQVDQGLFDEIPDEIMATIADITMAEADEGVLTQEEHPKLGTCFRSMKSWKNLREN
ncbi:hypothetical protein QL285_085977 [Trifolium repens]|nr:hypothetical protein QL285_085977 [Trifolium repens]